MFLDLKSPLVNGIILNMVIVMKVVKLNDTMYAQDIIIIINATVNQFKSYYFKKIGWNPPQPTSQGYFITAVVNDKETHFIYLKDFEWLICDYGLLAHEIFHCVCSVFESIGIGMSKESEEAWSYYLQHLYSEAISKIKDKLKDKN